MPKGARRRLLAGPRAILVRTCGTTSAGLLEPYRAIPSGRYPHGPSSDAPGCRRMPVGDVRLATGYSPLAWIGLKCL